MKLLFVKPCFEAGDVYIIEKNPVEGEPHQLHAYKPSDVGQEFDFDLNPSQVLADYPEAFREV